MSAETIRYGATPREWDTFAALGVPMLPVVANPNAPTSPDSKIPPENRGKVPSKFNSRRQVVGIPDWTSKALKPAMFDNMKADGDLGFCVVTGHGVVAIDVDVSDAALAGQIHAAIVEQLGNVPVRRRSNSAKFLAPIKVPGAIGKQILQTRAGKIEILGHGQQFVACGTHPSGVRYEWSWPTTTPVLPELTAQQWNALAASLAERFGNKPLPAEQPAASSVPQTAALTETEVSGAALEVQRVLERIALPGKGHRDTWLRTGMATHHHCSGSEEGFRVWHEWSAKQPAYESEDDCRTRWDSFGRRKNGAPVTIASLEALAREQRVYTVEEIFPAEERTKASIVDVLPGSPAAQTRAAAQAVIDKAAQFKPATRTARYLNLTEFSPLMFTVTNLLPEGVFLLAASPKVGKSWLALQLCFAVASGAKVLNEQATQGDALYLALDGDSDRRLKSRLTTLGMNALPVEALERMHFETKWDRMNEGGELALDEWLAAHPQTRLVVVDVLERVRPKRDPKANPYGEDYAALEALKRVAGKRRLSIVVVHHTRKASADDAAQLVSGTQGLTGAADGIIVLQRPRGEEKGTLHLIARDLTKDGDYSVAFKNGRWDMIGPAALVARTDLQNEILAALRTSGEPMGVTDIATAIGKAKSTTQQALNVLRREGRVKQQPGDKKYALPPEAAGYSSPEGEPFEPAAAAA